MDNSRFAFLITLIYPVRTIIMDIFDVERLTLLETLKLPIYLNGNSCDFCYSLLCLVFSLNLFTLSWANIYNGCPGSRRTPCKQLSARISQSWNSQYLALCTWFLVSESSLCKPNLQIFFIIIQYLCSPSIYFTFSDFLGGRLIKEMDIGNKNEATYIQSTQFTDKTEKKPPICCP